MPDVLDQIQQRQVIARDQEIAGAQRDVNWNSTFGKMAPDNVLRETRNMTALIANAVERKMELAAQTSAEAQRIYINDQKWKAEQRMQPLKDDRLRAQIKSEEARARATAAQERLTTSRLVRDATAIEHTASAEWEMDQIESATIPEAEKRAWVNTVRGKYPSMNNDATARHGKLHLALNPVPGSTPDEKIANAVKMTAATTAVREQAKAASRPVDETPNARIARIKAESTARAEGTAAGQTAKVPGAGKPDSYEQLTADRTAAVAAYGKNPVPAAVLKTFDARGQVIEKAGGSLRFPAPAAPATVAATTSVFKAGDTRSRGGVTYVRGEDGIWLPQP